MSVIRAQATKRGNKIFFVTSQVLCKQEDVVFVEHNSLDLYLHQKLPKDASVVVNLSNHSHDKVLFTHIAEIYRHSGAKPYDTDTFCGRASNGFASGRGSGQYRIKTEHCLDNVNLTSTHRPPIYEVVCPHDIAKRAAHGPSTVITRTIDNAVQIPIRPVTTDMQFHHEKSYLIIGSITSPTLCANGWVLVVRDTLFSRADMPVLSVIGLYG
jgi:hypothetical protein